MAIGPCACPKPKSVANEADDSVPREPLETRDWMQRVVENTNPDVDLSRHVMPARMTGSIGDLLGAARELHDKAGIDGWLKASREEVVYLLERIPAEHRKGVADAYRAEYGREFVNDILNTAFYGDFYGTPERAGEMLRRAAALLQEGQVPDVAATARVLVLRDLGVGASTSDGTRVLEELRQLSPEQLADVRRVYANTSAGNFDADVLASFTPVIDGVFTTAARDEAARLLASRPSTKRP